jgi:RNA polymerase sigma-70 factor (ECF subfamily)
MDVSPALSALFTQAQGAHPQVVLSFEDFLAHAQARSFDAQGPQAAHAPDFFLACACAQGDRAALATLERHVLPAARDALLRRNIAPSMVDEVLQQLRERLLVPRGSTPAKIAEYDGRGPLVAWVRTAAVRLALSELRSTRPSEELISAVVPAHHPELGGLREHHRAEFKAALESAFSSLEVRERTILRLHLLEGVGVEDIGRIHGVSRATMTRWLKAARDTLFERTREGLRTRLQLEDSEFQSLARTLLSQVDLSVRRLLDSSQE